MSLNEFIDMGGYGPYVWSCYGLTFAVLIGMGWSSRRQLAAEQITARRRAQIAAEQS